jgi:hypothetical protein
VTKVFLSTSLHDPAFDIHYNARLGGAPPLSAQPLRYALILTVRSRPCRICTTESLLGTGLSYSPLFRSFKSQSRPGLHNGISVATLSKMFPLCLHYSLRACERLKYHVACLGRGPSAQWVGFSESGPKSQLPIIPFLRRYLV